MGGPGRKNTVQNKKCLVVCPVTLIQAASYQNGSGRGTPK